MTQTILRIILYVVVIGVVFAGAQLGGTLDPLTLIFPIIMISILLLYFGRELRKRAKKDD